MLELLKSLLYIGVTVFVALFALLVLYVLYNLIPNYFAISKLGTRSPGLLWIINVDKTKLQAQLFNFVQTQAKAKWYHLWIGFDYVLLASTADQAKAILSTQRESFEKIQRPNFVTPNWTSNLVNANGDKWKSFRTVFNPAFKVDAYKKYLETFQKVIDTAINKMEDKAENNNRELDVNPWMTKMTLDLLGESIFHYNFGLLDETGNEYYEAYSNLLNLPRSSPYWRLFGKLLIHVPFLEMTRKLKYAAAKMEELFVKMLNGRMKHPNDSKVDILDHVLGSLESGDLTKDEVNANLFILFLAGHDTTSSSLSWALHALKMHLDVQDKLYEEIVRVVGKDNNVKYENIKELKYMTQFINEVLRLYAPVSLLPTRVAAEDVIVDGLKIPKGTGIGIDIYSIHRDENLWENSGEFDPDRFSPARIKGQHKFAHLPFSLGQRECIGNNFSIIEQHVFLTTLLQKYRVETPPSHELNLNQKNTFFYTLNEVYVSLQKR